MENEKKQTTCGATTCKLVYRNRRAYCEPGTPGSCFIGLRECDESELHDQKLIAATAAINNIVDQLNENSEERKASFFVSDAGIILVWAEHGAARKDDPNDAVSADSDRETIIREFGIKN